MSWEASLTDDRGHDEGAWNYTHNINRMLNTIIHPYENTNIGVGVEILFPDQDGREWHSWWKLLDGLTGQQGYDFLSYLVDALESDPPFFEAMNPPNGWGNYQDLVKILKQMCLAVPPLWPTVWRVGG